jgi:hypothetical protein
MTTAVLKIPRALGQLAGINFEVALAANLSVRQL